jgi:hypothetical protein
LRRGVLRRGGLRRGGLQRVVGGGERGAAVMEGAAAVAVAVGAAKAMRRRVCTGGAWSGFSGTLMGRGSGNIR